MSETHLNDLSQKPFVLWNKGKVTGQKPPLKPREVWAIRVRLRISARVRDLGPFNLANDSKLRGGDLVHLRVEDVMQGDQARTRALLSKTGAPVQFETTEQARGPVRTHRMSRADRREIRRIRSNMAPNGAVAVRRLGERIYR